MPGKPASLLNSAPTLFHPKLLAESIGAQRTAYSVNTFESLGIIARKAGSNKTVTKVASSLVHNYPIRKQVGIRNVAHCLNRTASGVRNKGSRKKKGGSCVTADRLGSKYSVRKEAKATVCVDENGHESRAM